MRLLELFSGTGSVGNVFKDSGWEVVSLDRDMAADIQTDIMDWDYAHSEYEPGYFDVIWSSPPCTEYSRAKSVGVRDIIGANRVVERTWDIITHFMPMFWFMENPQTGMLKDQLMMLLVPYTDVDYCKYGLEYRKRTRIWNNLGDSWVPRPLCQRDCGSMMLNGRKHLQVAQRGTVGRNEDNRRRFRREELYRIPAPLVEEIEQALRLLMS